MTATVPSARASIRRSQAITAAAPAGPVFQAGSLQVTANVSDTPAAVIPAAGHGVLTAGALGHDTRPLVRCHYRASKLKARVGGWRMHL